MATIDRPQSAQVVAHATEYPADRDGDGTGYDRRKKSNTAERPEADTQTDTERSDDSPAVFVEPHHMENHTLDGVAAYRSAALKVLEPGVDHSPVHPLRGPIDRPTPDSVRHAYVNHRDDDPPHEVNVAT